MQPNAFKCKLAIALTESGSETTVYVDSLETLTGETISFSNFTPFTRGILTVDPEGTNSEQPEFVSFTGIDGTGVSFTGATRGLSANSNSTVSANKVFHPVGTPVIIALGGHNFKDLVDYMNSVITGVAGNASTSVAGVTKLSTAPASPTNPIAVGDNDPRVPSQDENNAMAGGGELGSPSSSNKYQTETGVTTSINTSIAAKIKFGGTGSDGALSISSGATNIDLGSAQIVTKNYTSISITGTGSLTFTNPHANGTIIILKSQGGVTLTSSATPMIDASGLGGNGGAGADTGNGGKGGKGGGALYIECAGALNFTTASGISVAGQNGYDGVTHSAGGGGGGGGTCVVLYNAVTAATGTITISGGTGGNSARGTGTTADGVNGSKGSSLIYALNPNGGSKGTSGSVGAGAVAVDVSLFPFGISGKRLQLICGGGGGGGGINNNGGDPIVYGGGGGGGASMGAGTDGTGGSEGKGGTGSTGYSLVVLNTEFA